MAHVKVTKTFCLFERYVRQVEPPRQIYVRQDGPCVGHEITWANVNVIPIILNCLKPTGYVMHQPL
jgi:hypothetical protein